MNQAQSKEYDTLYKLGQESLDRHSPCNIKTCKDGAVACTLYPKGYRGSQGNVRGVTYCCEGCKYASDTGCTVKALDCKLWLCRTDTRNDNLFPVELIIELRTLRRMSYALGLQSTVRQPKPEVK